MIAYFETYVQTNFIYVYICTYSIYIYIDIHTHVDHIILFFCSVSICMLISYPIVYLVSAESLCKHSATKNNLEANLALALSLTDLSPTLSLSNFQQDPLSIVTQASKVHSFSTCQNCISSVAGCGLRGNEPNWTRDVDAMRIYAA